MLVEKKSSLTGVVHKMDLPVTEEQLRRYRKGALIQDVMPQLNEDQREFLISGCTREEWDKAFAEGI